MIGSTMLKTKGNSYFLNKTSGSLEVWDSIDVVNPPVEKGAAFLTTNFLRTVGQSRGICDSTDPCRTNDDCKGPSPNVDSGGIRTGNCTADGFCQVHAWCPVEPNIPGRSTFNFLQGVDAFTTFIRVSVNFPTEDKRTDSGSSLKEGVNLFTTSELLAKAGIAYDDVKQLGALVAISYDWTCNLNRAMSSCTPQVTYTRLDDPHSKFSTGFNYRYSRAWAVHNVSSGDYVEYRNLFKVYGVRFVVLVSGTGVKFDIKNLATNLGSGLAMLSVAAVVADILLVYILPKRALYKQVKVKEMEKYIDETDNEVPEMINGDREHRRLLP